MGYGLFLPRFREAFLLLQASAGLIASLAFSGFFFALLVTGWLVACHSARLPVVLGSLTALIGLLIVAVSQNSLMLTVGIGCSGALALGVTAWWPVLISAAPQGACVMILSAICAFWSERLYPGLPTISLTAVLIVFAAGNIVGPAAARYAADAIGMGATFLLIMYEAQQP